MLFMMGRMLKGYVDEEKRLVFGLRERKLEFDTARDVLRLYDDCITRARDATMTWMMIAKRLGLYRDVSVLVGRMVWDKKDAFMERALR